MKPTAEPAQPTARWYRRLWTAISLFDWIVILVSLVVLIWLWVALILVSEPDFDHLWPAFLLVNVAAGFLHTVSSSLHRPGSVSEKIRSPTVNFPSTGRVTSSQIVRLPSWLPFFLTNVAPALVCGAILLIITPSSTPSLDDDLGLYPAILILAIALPIIGRMLGGLVFVATLMPVGMIVGGVSDLRKGHQPATEGQALGTEYTPTSLVAGGCIIILIFQAIPMFLLWSSLAEHHDGSGLRWVALAWIPLTIVAIVVLIIINNRSVSQAAREWRAQLQADVAAHKSAARSHGSARRRQPRRGGDGG